MNHNVDCAAAMEWSFRLAREQVRNIRSIENRRPENLDKDDEVEKLLADVFIRACKDLAMGLIHWRSVKHCFAFDMSLILLLMIIISYHGERYFQKRDIRADYTIEFQL